MRIGAIVQARMSSARLPGKSLRPLCGQPLLQYVLERLRRLAVLSETVVATSIDPSDDPIAAFCEQFGCPCFRGSLEDVADRLLQAALAYRFSAFVRINGDSPVLDQRLVARGVDLFAKAETDLVTNVFPRTYPAGMSVEVIPTETFSRIVPELAEPGDREHVTAYFYRNAARFRVVNFARDVPRRDVHLAVDTPAHFDAMARLMISLPRPHWESSLEDVLRLCDQLSLCRAMAPPLPEVHVPSQVLP